MLREVGEFIRNWWPLLTFVASVLVAAGTWKLSSIFATRAAVKDLEKKVTALEGGDAQVLSRVESGLSALKASIERQGDQHATKADLAMQRDRITNAMHRLDLVEQRIEHLPDGDDLAELRNTLAGLDSQSAALKAKVEGIDDKVDVAIDSIRSIDNFLRKAG